jgi:hypothetical protein
MSDESVFQDLSVEDVEDAYKAGKTSYEDTDPSLPKNARYAQTALMAAAKYYPAGAAYFYAASTAIEFWYKRDAYIEKMEKYIMAVVPDAITAQGVPDWFSEIAEPIAIDAGKADLLLLTTAKETYRTVLEANGLVAKGKPIPSNLEWSKFRSYLGRIDPIANSHKAAGDFYQYVVAKADELGYNQARSYWLGRNTFLALMDRSTKTPTCGMLRPGYCVKLTGPDRRSDAPPAAEISASVARAIKRDRLDPLEKAYSESLAVLSKAVEQYKSDLGKLVSKISIPQLRIPTLVAQQTEPSVVHEEAEVIKRKERTKISLLAAAAMATAAIALFVRGRK